MDFDRTYLEQARFAARVNRVDIEFRNLSVYDVGRLGERFDLVLFIGVLYHLRHPLLALDLIHEHVANDLFVFQSMQRGSAEVAALDDDYEFFEDGAFDNPGYPCLYFVEKKYAHDPTNWWIPNRACAEAMLRSAGFAPRSLPGTEIYLCELAEPSPWGGAVYPAAPGGER